MSDSYVLGRTETKVKRRKPPKKPNQWPGPFPWYTSAYATFHFAIAYGTSASDQKVSQALLAGFWLLVYARDLWVWWSWRRWSRHANTEAPSALPYRWLAVTMRSLAIAATGYLLASDLLDWFVEGKLPGQ